MTLEDGILEKIMPTAAQRKKASSVVEEVRGKLRKKAHELGIDAEPILVGSVAKDTALTLTDIDIFIMFPAKTSVEDLQKYGLLLGESVVRGEKRYAQHPYTHGDYGGFTLDIVPCYRIESPSQKMSAVDRTPFHTEFVIKNLRDGQRGDVRLVKQFLKGIGAYGAEAEVQGFSGYLCEVLVIKYGNFEKVLEAARDFRRGTCITLNSAKSPRFEDPFIVVDPIDPTRNAAAAVSIDRLFLFVHAASEYLKNRKAEFFFPKKAKPKPIGKIRKTISERGTGILGLEIEKPDVVDDILYSQVKKCEKGVAQLAEQYGFRVCASGYFVDGLRMLFIFEFETCSLPAVSAHTGPPFWHPNAREFLEKWNKADRFAGPYIAGDRWVVDVKREFRTPDELLRARLAQAGVGKDIAGKVEKGKYKVIPGKKLLVSGKAGILTEFFDKRFPWER
jgi:tRNA nucleotidyltransferase (CCA-adding enzyme)